MSKNICQALRVQIGICQFLDEDVVITNITSSDVEAFLLSTGRTVAPYTIKHWYKYFTTTPLEAIQELEREGKRKRKRDSLNEE